MISVEARVEELNAALVRYAELSRREPEDIVLKQGAKLAFALSGRLRLLAPKKGAVRAERLAALESGGGIAVRESVRRAIWRKHGVTGRVSDRRLVIGDKMRGSIKRSGKRVNIQALAVQRELSVRESGRGYLGFAARFLGIGKVLKLGKSERYLDRVRRTMSTAGLSIARDDATLRLRFVKDDIAGALGGEKQKAAIAGAIAEVRADIQQYVDRKMAENARKAGLK